MQRIGAEHGESVHQMFRINVGGERIDATAGSAASAPLSIGVTVFAIKQRVQLLDAWEQPGPFQPVFSADSAHFTTSSLLQKSKKKTSANMVPPVDDDFDSVQSAIERHFLDTTSVPVVIKKKAGSGALHFTLIVYPGRAIAGNDNTQLCFTALHHHVDADSYDASFSAFLGLGGLPPSQIKRAFRMSLDMSKAERVSVLGVFD